MDFETQLLILFGVIAAMGLPLVSYPLLVLDTSTLIITKADSHEINRVIDVGYDGIILILIGGLGIATIAFKFLYNLYEIDTYKRKYGVLP